MRARLAVQTVKDRARGRGGAIVVALAPHLAGAVARGPHKNGPCPLCGGRDRFRALKDFEERGAVYCNQCGRHLGDFFATLRWANGWTFPETLAAVASFLGMAPDAPGAPRSPVPSPAPTPIPDEGKKARLRRVWGESCPIHADDPVDCYLKSRGLDFLGHWPSALRFHPGLFGREDDQLLGPFPAMLARIDAQDGHPVGIHRTFLRPDGFGKAPLESAKKIMPTPSPGATRGGAIRLFGHGERLAVAEGVETALAVQCLTGLPAWATVSAGGMEALVVPAGVREVFICGDNDASGRGQEAARKLAARLLEEGRRVRVAIPTEPGADWADVWLKEVRP